MYVNILVFKPKYTKPVTMSLGEHIDGLLQEGCTLQWRHTCNERDGISNYRPHDCLLNRLIRRKSKKTSKLRVTGFCVGNSPHKGPVTRKMFPFDDVIINSSALTMELRLSCTNTSKYRYIPHECNLLQIYRYSACISLLISQRIKC